jgi:hypothetical protein
MWITSFVHIHSIHFLTDKPAYIDYTAIVYLEMSVFQCVQVLEDDTR